MSLKVYSWATQAKSSSSSKIKFDEQKVSLLTQKFSQSSSIKVREVEVRGWEIFLLLIFFRRVDVETVLNFSWSRHELFRSWRFLPNILIFVGIICAWRNFAFVVGWENFRSARVKNFVAAHEKRRELFHGWFWIVESLSWKIVPGKVCAEEILSRREESPLKKLSRRKVWVVESFCCWSFEWKQKVVEWKFRGNSWRAPNFFFDHTNFLHDCKLFLNKLSSNFSVSILVSYKSSQLFPTENFETSTFSRREKVFRLKVHFRSRWKSLSARNISDGGEYLYRARIWFFHSARRKLSNSSRVRKFSWAQSWRVEFIPNAKSYKICRGVYAKA